MPFHIRLVNRTNPRIARAVEEPVSKSAVLINFFQGIAYGLGVAVVMFAVLWFVQTNNFGL